MSEFPETQYAESDGLSIAYQVWGKGPSNLVVVPGIVSHLEAALDRPEYVHFSRALSRHFRMLTFDKRGNGMSDRISGAPTLDERVKDIEAVMDAAEVDNGAFPRPRNVRVGSKSTESAPSPARRLYSTADVSQLQVILRFARRNSFWSILHVPIAAIHLGLVGQWQLRPR